MEKYYEKNKLVFSDFLKCFFLYLTSFFFLFYYLTKYKKCKIKYLKKIFI